MAKVVVVRLVLVGFPLEGDGKVSAEGAAGLHQTEQPFETVPQIERHHEHLQQLTRVDAFVMQVGSIKCPALSDEDEAEEVDSRKFAERNETIVDHAGMSRKLELEVLVESDECRVHLTEATQLFAFVIRHRLCLCLLNHRHLDDDAAVVELFA